MPNWVFCSLTVEGDPDSVIDLKNQLNAPFTRFHEQWNIETQEMENKEYTYDNPVFSFWNIFNPLDEGVSLDVYNKQPDHSVPFEERILFSGNDWYSWNVRNWGTKWDIAVSNDEKYPDTELLEEEPNGDNLVLVYKFQTAWSPALPAIEKLSVQYPDLLFTLNYEEETGWGGEVEFLRGGITAESTYDWQCRECGHEEDETPYCEECEFDMCPECGYGEPMEEDRAKCKEHREEANV